MNGAMKIVMNLSLLLLSVRAAMTAGTVQPKPISSGMKLLPCRPTLLMKRSMTKAARAM